MQKEMNSTIGYIADYRNVDKNVNKAVPITTVERNSPVRFTGTGSKTNTASLAKSTTYEESVQVDTVSVENPLTKRAGLYRIFFACIMMLLTVSGIMILFYALSRTAIIMNNSPANAKYSNYIAPVVMHDPAPFEDVELVDQNTKIASCIWRNIFQNGVSAYNEIDEQGLTLMPTSDVQRACTELFGPNAKIDIDANINGQFFSLASGEDCFHIGAISNASSFVPYIEDITEKKDVISLAVSYLSRDDKYFSSDDDKADKPSPVKRMIYNLKLNEGTNKYYIQSIKTP